MLKFSNVPVKRKTVAAPVKKEKKVRVPRKSLLLSTEKPKTIMQEYAAIDQFGELAGRKRQAAERARGLGHDLLPWHQRANDPAGRYNAFCSCCNMLAVVCTEAPDGFPDIYGHALTRECSK